MTTPQPPARPAVAHRLRRALLIAGILPALVAGWLGWRVVSGRPQGSPQAVELAQADLGPRLTGATVLAVGEATHGTREFRQVWQQVAAKVVSQGFTTIVLEENAGPVSEVDAWVQGGPGTAEEAVRRFGFRLNHTQEMVDFVTWARTYNTGRPAAERVRFYGIDMQRAAADAAVVLAHLKQVDPTAHARFSGPLGALANDLQTNKQQAAQVKPTIDDLVAHLDQRTAAADDDPALRAGLSARSLQWGVRRGIEGINSFDRDKAMFAQLDWLVAQRERAGSHHSLLLAHNGHVDRSGQSSAASGSKLGVLCAAKWHDAYRVIGTDAHHVRLQDAGSTFSFTVRSPLRGLFAGTRTGFLELSEVTAADRGLLRRSQPMASAGNGFASWMAWLPMAHEVKVVPETTWDALVLVDDSHPTTPLPR